MSVSKANLRQPGGWVFSWLFVPVLLAACAVPHEVGGRQVGGAEVHGNEAYSPLPEGVALPMSYHVRADRYYVSKENGTLRRKVDLEIRGQELVRTVELVENALLSAGYRVAGEPKTSKKRTKLTFKRKKTPTITVEFAQDLGKGAADPRADHLVTLRWKAADSLDQWLALGSHPAE